jgi:hypothetical protein
MRAIMRNGEITKRKNPPTKTPATTVLASTAIGQHHVLEADWKEHRIWNRGLRKRGETLEKEMSPLRALLKESARDQWVLEGEGSGEWDHLIMRDQTLGACDY